MTIDIIKNNTSFLQLKDQWNTLLENSENRDVLYTHQWYNCWINSFISDNEMFVLIGKNSKELQAVFPLMKTTFKKYGFKIKIIKSITGKNSLRFDYITKIPSPEILGTFITKALHESDYQMMVLEKVPESSLILQHLQEAAKIYNFKYIFNKEVENCLIRIENNFNNYFNGLKSKFKKNARAAERKALEHGPLLLHQPNSVEDLDDILERIFKVELLSWKGQIKRAIIQDTKNEIFFKMLSREFYESGGLLLSLLQNNKNDIAFFYCIYNYGIIRAMKIAYDDNFRNIGPGMIVIKKTLEKVFEEKKYKLLDFGGGLARWKEDWAMETENLYSIFIFKNDIFSKMLYILTKYYKTTHPYKREMIV